MSRLDWISKWADYTPNKQALISFDSNEQYTYRDLNEYANRMQRWLSELKLTEGDRIAVLSEHCLEFIVLFISCQRLGIILVPLNYRLSANELNLLIEDCSPQLFLYSCSQRDLYNSLEVNCRTESICNVEAIYKNPTKTENRRYQIKDHNPIFIFYTSGTTGKPKGVIYTNKMMFWNSLNTSMELGITFKDSTINILPPYHTSGWNVLITPLLHQGALVGILKKFNSDQVLRLLDENRITLFMALPTMLLMMQRSKEFLSSDLLSLRYIISGGETVLPKIITHWRKTKKLNIRPGYGLTEAGPSITSLHHKMALLKPSSIGKPNFYVETKIIDHNGNLVEKGQLGELCIKGDVVTPGYWNDSVLTHNKIKEEWLHTGDFVYEDDEGYLYIEGRKDDMYISGGENIYPREIEKCLESFDAIEKAVILSVNNEKWGQVGVAFVKLKNQETTIKEIKNYMHTSLCSYKHPKHIILIEEIPLSSLGKVSRPDLLRLYKSLKMV